MAEENFDKLRNLLSQKATDMPSDAYFDGVLGELHRRQRAALIPTPNRWRQAWDSFLEAITPVVPDFTPAYRYATALVAAGAIGVGGWTATSAILRTGPALNIASLNSAASLNGQNNAATAAPATQTSYVSSAAPVVDNFDVAQSADAPTQSQPHYMLTSASPVDNGIAF
ncbi:MAG: hypothetical protein ACAI35_23360 [Candidatus Methylacidiphilales bacterium]|nr:hypothetical protein [Candidatus Methylacidiphilales bacterium]